MISSAVACRTLRHGLQYGDPLRGDLQPMLPQQLRGISRHFVTLTELWTSSR